MFLRSYNLVIRPIKMKIFLLICIIIIAILILGKNIFYSAKRNLFKDQAVWSGKDIKIKYSNSSKVSKVEPNENYLKMIAEESSHFLDDHSEIEEK